MKKISTLILCMAITVMSVMPCFAGTYSEDGSANCEVIATVESTYSVSLPATVTLTHHLSDADGVYSYKESVVGAKGNINDSSVIDISVGDAPSLVGNTPTNTTTCYYPVGDATRWYWLSTKAKSSYSTGGGSDASVAAAPAATGEYTYQTLSIAAPLTNADTYRGNLTFNFALKQVSDI